MKKFVAIFMSMVVGVGIFTACGGKNGEAAAGLTMKDGQTVKTVVGQIEDEIGIAMPADLEDQVLKDLFYIDPADVEEYSGRMAMVMNSADNVVAVRAKAGKIETVQQALEKRLEDVRNSFANYLPEQSDKAQKGQVVVKGDYAFLLILGESTETLDADMEKALKIIDAAF